MENIWHNQTFLDFALGECRFFNMKKTIGKGDERLLSQLHGVARVQCAVAGEAIELEQA